MPDQHGLNVVLGAGGGTGGAIVDELVRRGLPVRAVTHRAAPTRAAVENVVADLADHDAARDALSGATVVYHAANPPYHTWAEAFPPLNASVVAATSAAGARLVFADNLYMYGPRSGVMTEDTPVRATDKKGALRASLAEKLLVAQAAGELEVVIGRSPDCDLSLYVAARMVWDADRDDAQGGTYARAHLGSVSSTVAGGTSEIQRNIIATRGLGLPRG